MRTTPLIALLIVAAAASATESEDQIRCSSEGRTFAKAWKIEHEAGNRDPANALFGDAVVDGAEFHFSRSLETCLAYTAVTQGEVDRNSPEIWRERRITDVYANRVLVYTRYMTDKKTKEEFHVPLKDIGDARQVTDSEFAHIKAEYFSD